MKRPIILTKKSASTVSADVLERKGFFISVVVKDDYLFVIWEENNKLVYSKLSDWDVMFMN